MRGPLMEDIYCIKKFNIVDCKFSRNTKKIFAVQIVTLLKTVTTKTCYYESIEYRNKI